MNEYRRKRKTLSPERSQMQHPFLKSIDRHKLSMGQGAPPLLADTRSLSTAGWDENWRGLVDELRTSQFEQIIEIGRIFPAIGGLFVSSKALIFSELY